MIAKPESNPSHSIRSEPFEGPYVRLRVNVTPGQNGGTPLLRWAPGFRTFTKPRETPRSANLEFGQLRRAKAAVVQDQFFFQLSGSGGHVLERVVARPMHITDGGSATTFWERLRYHPKATRVSLWKGPEELGGYEIDPNEPTFELLHPLIPVEMARSDWMPVAWRSVSAKLAKMVYYADFTTDGNRWHRLVAGTTTTRLAIDLGGMPGKSIQVRILATNGFHTVSAQSCAISIH